MKEEDTVHQGDSCGRGEWGEEGVRLSKSWCPLHPTSNSILWMESCPAESLCACQGCCIEALVCMRSLRLVASSSLFILSLSCFIAQRPLPLVISDCCFPSLCLCFSVSPQCVTITPSLCLSPSHHFSIRMWGGWTTLPTWAMKALYSTWVHMAQSGFRSLSNAFPCCSLL